MKSIIELAIVTQLIDHRDTEESLPADFVQSLREFATAIRAQALEEVADMVSACDPRATPKGIAAAIRALKEMT